MKKDNKRLLTFIVLIMSAVFVAKCGNSGSGSAKSVDSEHVKGPAPDNNSANNPSLADTNYEKDRTRPITDTMKNRDSLKNK